MTNVTSNRGQIGQLIRDGLLAGKSPDDILAEVKAEVPDARTSKQTIAWYRADLVNKGMLERKRAPRKPKEAAPATEQDQEAEADEAF